MNCNAVLLNQTVTDGSVCRRFLLLQQTEIVKLKLHSVTESAMITMLIIYCIISGNCTD